MNQQFEALLRGAAGNARVIGLAGGLPSVSQFPRRQLAQSFMRVMRQSGTPALQYGWAEGSDRLRGFVARRLRARGADISVEDIVVTSGAQQAIAMAVELSTARGDEIAVEPTTYPAALELFRLRGRVAVPRLTDVRCAYVMPAVSNPSGRALGTDQRKLLLQSGMPIIEDDAYADLRFAGPATTPLLAAAPDRVFHVGTLSKILCPGLRVGWLVVPHRLRERALDLKQGVDLQSSSLSQAIVEDYLIGSDAHPGIDLEARLAGLRRFYHRRASHLARMVRRYLPGWSFEFPAGGFALWIETNLFVPETEFLARAIAEGVSYDPGSLFRPPDAPSSPLTLRLCFSYAALASFDEGVKRLARAWGAVTSTSKEGGIGRLFGGRRMPKSA